MVETRCVVGIDLSMVSPAMAVFCNAPDEGSTAEGGIGEGPSREGGIGEGVRAEGGGSESEETDGAGSIRTGRWHLYCFAQRVKEVGKSRCIAPGVTLVFLPSIPNSAENSNCVRYEHIRFHLLRIIADLVDYQPRVHIEGYAFSAHTNASYKLHELGGILKHSIFQLLRQECSTTPPTQWKKRCTGNGKLSKLEMVRFLEDHGPKIDLFAVFGKPVTATVPCPIQDIADSVGIVLAALTPVLPQSKRKPGPVEPSSTKRAKRSYPV